ncbi:MAG TPA: DNA repair protein RadA [Candidatus Dormibacteraeota bacterium]|nr:DNA repair protein RadA [Candidatus Dormibacteraeota bacterium]
MAKAKPVFFCASCGHESPRWLGRCPGCDAWNSFAEAPVSAAASSRPGASPALGRRAARSAGPVLVPLREVETGDRPRVSTGMQEFDTLLGGGVVAGSVILIGGEPGVGKSTLLLDVLARLARVAGPAVYLSGEESAAQTKLRAQRLGGAGDVLLVAESNLGPVLDEVERAGARVLVVDSIQTVYLEGCESGVGSVAQVRECAQAIQHFAKRTGCATFVVGHVTKDGAIAGPRLLEHLVDTVLYFEGDGAAGLRVLRSYKNRFGSVDEICVFAMGESGLREITEPSKRFLDGRSSRASGSCVVPGIVGSRPILLEVQALLAGAAYGTPRRLASSLDAGRLAIVLAVLEKHAGLLVGGQDVYASVAGGLRIAEPASDLALALAIASAHRNVALPHDLVAFGELGLSGEVRGVGQGERRLAEAARLGFTTAIVPHAARGAAAPRGMRVIPVDDVARALAAAWEIA